MIALFSIGIMASRHITALTFPNMTHTFLKNVFPMPIIQNWHSLWLASIQHFIRSLIAALLLLKQVRDHSPSTTDSKSL